MGNTESNVTSGVKKQAGASMQAIYKLCNLKGGGLLVELMKRAAQNKQYAEIDHAIKTKVEQFLYNKGQGRYFPIVDLVLLRNAERGRHKLVSRKSDDCMITDNFFCFQLPPLRAMENPEDYEINENAPEVTEEEYRKNPHLYRHVCWKIKERGAVGETILHLCLLNATSLHADLAKRLLRFYPRLINDIYMSDEYYGENVLHIAIVNEDPGMVKFLLGSGVNFQERCFGNFMCPEDQKSSRTDSLTHEWVNVCPETNYEGYVYWGEYPLTFAACLGQEESFRLILAKGADPNAQDTNGNTVLHLLVIYEKLVSFSSIFNSIEKNYTNFQEAFDMAYEVGAKLSIRNVLQLTPLTLSAKLARVEIFFHILNIEREIYWQIGSITCAAYPLSQIDTIDVETGRISKVSALNLVVFGDKDEHLELLDGVLIDLLKTKWNTFVKFKFYRQFFTFAFYFLISLVAFTLRPGPPMQHHQTSNKSMNSTNHPTNLLNHTIIDFKIENLTLTKDDGNVDMEEWWENLQEECRLMDLSARESQIRFFCEVAMTIGAFSYLAAAVREARFLGLRMFFENLMTAPSRVMFLFSCILMQIVPWLRLACQDEFEDFIAVIIMLTTAPYFLFFCRGFKTVGPFVVMIYRMVMGDLIRFATIYLVFVMGFSQAFYLIFLSYDNPLTPDDVDDSATNPMSTPIESIMAMFLMSMTNFGDYYGAFEKTEHEILAKFLFVMFMVIVSILLINMLIAMMGNTYQKIAETRNEWQRQWARIVLVVERGVSPEERLKQLMVYSQPMSDGRRALVLRLNQSNEDKEEMKEILEMKRRHDRNLKKREEKLQK
ncbi:transient receptor potential cation channel subfamily V member 5 [Coccinella septempunctata]|uniref:transient receptor potential cation channel subfamily V member 5 n=1 Tax=Coccinella septempunctata TaxID=41139 RepID=UPI001D098CDC|nr:transient receptor potential cation channel subfamily V member 5 [Coccinella septempunctata]